MENADVKNILNFIAKNLIHDKEVYKKAPLIVKLIKESNLIPSEIYTILQNRKENIIQALADTESNINSKIIYIFSFIKRSETLQYAGCYQIINKQTGTVYIGESINIFRRIQIHIQDLYENNHHCKELQKAFNVTHRISDFIIQPLYIFPIINYNKVEVKIDTLYLEAAYYLVFKEKHKTIYNFVDPYQDLIAYPEKTNKFDIKNSEVLKRLYIDKYDIFPTKLFKKKIQEEIAQVISIDELSLFENQYYQRIGLLEQDDVITEKPKRRKEKESERSKLLKKKPYLSSELLDAIEITKERRVGGEKLYHFNEIIADLIANNLLPEKYEYAKVRTVLKDHGLISFDPENNKTIATQYALDNDFYLIGSVLKDKNTSALNYSYYITENGKNEIATIVSKYEKTYFEPDHIDHILKASQKENNPL